MYFSYLGEYLDSVNVMYQYLHILISAIIFRKSCHQSRAKRMSAALVFILKRCQGQLSCEWSVVKGECAVSHTCVEREEVNVQEKDGVEKQGLFVLQFLHTQQGACTEGCPHHPQ